MYFLFGNNECHVNDKEEGEGNNYSVMYSVRKSDVEVFPFFAICKCVTSLFHISFHSFTADYRPTLLFYPPYLFSFFLFFSFFFFFFLYLYYLKKIYYFGIKNSTKLSF